VTVQISARAQRELERCDSWWRANRDAKDLLVQEFLEVVARLDANPDLGTAYEAVRFESPVRRVLMPKTAFHVYHARLGDNVLILSIWNGRRGRGPKL
jgi:plasmid stabilization system protein ParE